MKRKLSLLVIGILSTACSPGMTLPDLGSPQPDQSMAGQDLGTLPNDQGAVDANGPSLTLSLVAGQLGGPGNADDTGMSARFRNPLGVVPDGAGNLYVADTDNDTIRKVVLATGAVTTLAGTAGSIGYADGIGAAARFNGPTGLATDGAGNLYVADTGNNTIRKVVLATGVVTTLAGNATLPGSADGTGPAARFISPRGVALDGAGNLYVADEGNHTVRVMVLATGAVTTLAGAAGMYGNMDGTGAAARFNSPFGVAADGAGNLNGDYVPTYITWLTTACRSCPHEHAIRSAGRPAATAHSAA